MALRLSTIAIPRFAHGGVDVGPAWAAIEVPSVPKQARQDLVDVLVNYVGTHIQVHPDDGPELARLGLEFVAAPDGHRRLRAAVAAAAVKAASKT